MNISHIQYGSFIAAIISLLFQGEWVFPTSIALLAFAMGIEACRMAKGDTF